MNELTQDVNWLAVIVGFVAAYMLGWLWYSPKMFGNKWLEGSKVVFEEGAPMPMVPMITQAIGTFLLSWVVGITAAQEALLTCLLIMLTLAVLIAAGGMYNQKSNAAIGIESSFVIAMVVVMIVCQGIF